MTSRTCELNAASDLQAVGRLQNQIGIGASTVPIIARSGGLSSSDKRLSDLLDAAVSEEDRLSDLLAYVVPAFFAVRARRARLESLAFGGGAR
jgi:hypothetical protein